MSNTYGHPVQVLKEWVKRVNARDIEGVLALYSYDAVLIPTFSPEIRTSRERIRDYFENLAKHEDIVVDLHVGSITVQPAAGNCHCLGGTYGWSWKAGEGREAFEARFTYVVDLGKEQPILHHHSSAVPG
jgi:hypothetical protein